jgi:anti-anti-sigma factor
MPPTETRIRVKRHESITKIEFIDRNILDEANIRMIGEEIGAVIDSADMPKLLISFANVEHLSSAALGELLKVKNRINGKSGQLRLADIDAQIYDVFVITRLNQLFSIHATSEDAMKSFS